MSVGCWVGGKENNKRAAGWQFLGRQGVFYETEIDLICERGDSGSKGKERAWGQGTF